MSKEFDDKWRDIKNEMVIRMSNKAIGMGELLKLFNFVEAHIKELENEVAFWKDDADKERLEIIIDCLKSDCDKKYERIAELEEALKPKTCVTCKHCIDIAEHYYCNMINVDISNSTVNTFYCNRYKPKDNA